MDCDRCGDYIEEFAVCPDCVTELEQQITEQTTMVNNLKKLLIETRPYANCYKRICETLNIDSDILEHVNKLKQQIKRTDSDILEHVNKLKQQIKRTPLELAAEKMYGLLKTISGCFREYEPDGLTSEGKTVTYLIDGAWVYEIFNLIIKAQDNPSPQANPPEQDEHKSVP